jgi:hypothetical protein
MDDHHFQGYIRKLTKTNNWWVDSFPQFPRYLWKLLMGFVQAMGLKSSVSILLDEADTDRDGRMSLPEFQKLLHQASLGSRTNHNHPHHRH